jgi:branched-chain amino acid transport system substrate-binding protein
VKTWHLTLGRLTRLSACLVFAVCSSLLAACSLPGGPGGAGSVTPTVKLGLSAPFEGLYRDLGYEVLQAVRLAVRQRNAAGGLGGRYLVELVALNDFNEPQEAVRQAGEMATDPDILGVLGGWSAETARQASPEYRRLGLLFLVPAEDPARLGAEAARFAAHDLGALRAVILHGDSVSDAALASAFETGFASQGGAVVATIAPSPGARGSDWLRQSLSARPDLFFVAVDAPAAAEWIAQIREAGYAGPVVGGPGLGSPLLVKIGGEMVVGVFYVSQFPPLQRDPGFVAGYQALSGGAPPSPISAWAYAAAGRLLDALDVAASSGTDDFSPVAIQAALPGRLDGGLGAYIYVIQADNVFGQP